MTIRATIDHGNVKYAVSDNGYILALDNNENELFKFPINTVLIENVGMNALNDSYYSANLTLPNHQEIHLQESPDLTPFVEAFKDELNKAR